MESSAAEHRRRPRISTMILCEIRIGKKTPELVRVRDLSEFGIKIATRQPLLLGDFLRVRLPGSNQWTLARVAWCSNGVAGLAFVRAVDLPQVGGLRTLGVGAHRLTPVKKERMAS